jgi:hypothetical protein
MAPRRSRGHGAGCRLGAAARPQAALARRTGNGCDPGKGLGLAQPQSRFEAATRAVLESLSRDTFS